ncbi:heme-binding protein soul3 isoform X2 [Sparus aurata]|uniref:Heme-binding protein soul3 n=1 Tax=Sparus aurata TaxID=8175 RepID=A0A671TQI0_SPAAU|nr:heme-binding protein 1-like isoform X2 [Sparus aurata]
MDGVTENTYLSPSSHAKRRLDVDYYHQLSLSCHVRTWIAALLPKSHYLVRQLDLQILRSHDNPALICQIACPEYTNPSSFKCGELLFERRQYEKGHWACIRMREDTYEQSICYGFMRIMKYICQQNSVGDYLGMTLPIVTVVRTNENQAMLSHEVTVAYFLPAEHQAQPPQPTDSEIVIEIWPTTTVYARPFSGPTNEVTIIDQISAMAELLDSTDMCVHDSFIVAGYTNPAHSQRQNEIWFLERP